MKIIVASSVLQGREAFETLGDVSLMPDDHISRSHLLDADILICRSKTRINQSLLDGTAVRFVGCAVAGMDHIDASFMEEAGIAWCVAPGCNANSVAEYVVTALLIEARRHDWTMDEMTMGVIGVGHTGTRVLEKAMALGINTLSNDPPRAAMESSAKNSFVSLDTLLQASDVITMHVPLKYDGRWPTAGLVDYRFFERFESGKLFINTARGEVMNSDAVRDALQHGVVRQAVLDVWEDEPHIRKDLLDMVDIGTPHIAGYSYEGRLQGTRMVYEEVCHFLEVDPVWPGINGNGYGQEHCIDATNMSDQNVWTQLATTAYPLLIDDEHFRAGVSTDSDTMAKHFVHCRQHYPERHEFSACRIRLQNASSRAVDGAWKLGFQITD